MTTTHPVDEMLPPQPDMCGLAALPDLRVGVTYLPIPVGGLLTLIFVVEKLLLGDQSNRKAVRFDQVEESEGAA